jgi:hypothetical protein
MREWSPYHIQPKHLDGYMVSKQGEFRLTPLANDRTLVEATTWYSHGLWPAEYWRWWSDAIIHRIHLRVLNHIRELAENSPSAPSNESQSITAAGAATAFRDAGRTPHSRRQE